MEFLAPVSLLLAGLLVVGMPIGFAMGIAGTVGLYLIGGLNLALGILSVAPYRNTASWLLTAIPLFILMAEILSASRISSDMFRAANKWVGHLPGGLAVATVFTSAGFGAVSGSSTAATATMARTVAPEAERYGYDRGMIVGTVAAAGTLSIMIPPSVVLMVYGIITETSIGGLFIAGILPGLVTALSFAGITMVWATLNCDLAPPVHSHGWRERFASLRYIWPVVLLFVFVVAGIYSGAVTVTEAAAREEYGRLLPINAAGAVGATVTDMGLAPIWARAFALIGRSAGLLAHLMEECENPQGQKIWDMILEQDDSAELAGFADPARAEERGKQK